MPCDFIIKEDKPVTNGLIIDASSSMRSKLGEVVAATLAFAKSSNPDDEVFAIRFNDDVRQAVPTGRFLLGDLHALETAVSSLVPEGRTALYDALVAGLGTLDSGTRPRRVLIL